jgi:hypothetical protein
MYSKGRAIAEYFTLMCVAKGRTPSPFEVPAAAALGKRPVFATLTRAIASAWRRHREALLGVLISSVKISSSRAS